MTLPWFKLFVDMPDHPKSDELAVVLADDDAWSRVVALWCWAAKHRPDGDLSGLSDVVIAKRARWRGDAEAFVKALEDVGFLDGRTLHDFAEEQEAHAKKLARDQSRMAQKREAAKVARKSGDHREESVRRSHDGRTTVASEREKETEKDPREGVLAMGVDPSPLPASPVGQRLRRHPGNGGIEGFEAQMARGAWVADADALIAKYGNTRGSEWVGRFLPLDGKSNRLSLREAVAAKWTRFKETRLRSGDEQGAVDELVRYLAEMADRHRISWERERGIGVKPGPGEYVPPPPAKSRAEQQREQQAKIAAFERSRQGGGT